MRNSKRKDRWTESGPELAPPPGISADGPLTERRTTGRGLARRLQEARQALAQQGALATKHRIAGLILLFGQYIFGGLLASSFMQDMMSKQMMGVLGLFVLASSLVRQHYNPEIHCIAANQRAARLRALIRETEDGILSAREGSPDALPPHEARKILSDGIRRIGEELPLIRANGSICKTK
jgi:hypothetical protein